MASSDRGPCVVKVVTSAEEGLRPRVYGDEYNRPHARKDFILAALGCSSREPAADAGASAAAAGAGDDGGSAAVKYVRVDPAVPATGDSPAPRPSLTTDPSALAAHDVGLLEFLATAWDRWVKLADRRDSAFFHDGYDGMPVESSSSAAAGSGGEGGDDSGAPEILPPALVPAQTPIRDGLARPGRGVMGQCAFYATDRFTPIFEGVAATLEDDLAVVHRAVSELVSVADQTPATVYALTTHPGHHAGRGCFGGYCYINNVAVAAEALMRSSGDRFKRVAVIDVDYHAGNGTVSIFYNDPRVMVASLHIDPELDYPFNVCYADQTGGPEAPGLTLCVPLPAKATWADHYEAALKQAVAAVTGTANGDSVATFAADCLVVSLGLDTANGDHVAAPGAGFTLELDDYAAMGRVLETAGVPTLFVQEGGYEMDVVGPAVRAVLDGFASQRAERP